MDQLHVEFVVIVIYSRALFEALVAVSALSCEAVDCDFVDVIQVDWLVVDSNCLDENSLAWFLAAVPGELDA